MEAAVAFDVTATYRTRQSDSCRRRFDIFRDDPASLVETESPDIVILAAHIEPTLTETAARKAAERFVDACAQRRLVYVSSDAIFDGRKGLYDEDDTPAPVLDYGRGLAYMETAVRRSCRDHLIVRPSYLYGYSSGRLDSRLAQTRAQLSQGESTVRFDDMFKSPIEVNQAARLILRLAKVPFVGTVHVAGPRMSVFDFHRDAMIALGVPVGGLTPEAMPTDKGLLRDTSLSTKRLRDLTGETPKSVRESLAPLE